MAKPNRKPLCFVVSPIGEDESETRIESDWLLDGIIRPAIDERYEVIRADEITEPGMINSQVIAKMFDAELVIASLTNHNANVFYELGIRHSVSKKPTIHMIIKGQSAPFDNIDNRMIKYSRVCYQDVQKSISDLRAAINDVEASDFEVDNPVTQARGRQSAQLSGETPLNEQMVALLDRVPELEKKMDELMADQKESVGDFMRRVVSGGIPLRGIYGDAFGYPSMSDMLNREHEKIQIASMAAATLDAREKAKKTPTKRKTPPKPPIVEQGGRRKRKSGARKR